MMKFYASRPSRSDLQIFQAWDFAITEAEQNDYTVGVTLGQDHRDNLYVLDVRRFKTGDGDIIIENILDYYEEYDADLLGFEDGQIWKAIASSYQRSCEKRRLYPSFEILQPLTDKMVRAQPLRGRMQAGKVYFDEKAPWYDDLRKELMRFPAGKHDDQIDALAWAVRLSLLRQAPKENAPPPIKSWRDKLNTLSKAGFGAGHMSA
jgi:predicted phage terminase large subunit-like protein